MTKMMMLFHVRARWTRDAIVRRIGMAASMAALGASDARRRRRVAMAACAVAACVGVVVVAGYWWSGAVDDDDDDDDDVVEHVDGKGAASTRGGDAPSATLERTLTRSMAVTRRSRGGGDEEGEGERATT